LILFEVHDFFNKIELYLLLFRNNNKCIMTKYVMACLNNIELVVIGECAICSNNNGGTHDCPRCKKDAWFICNNCKEALVDKNHLKCPVCNLDMSNTLQNNTNANNADANDANPDANDDNHDGKICYNCNDLLSLCIFVSQILCSITAVLFILTFGQYLGKIYIYSYCKTTCVDKDDPDKCSCGKFASRSGYWYDFTYAFGEFLCGAFVTCILYGFCCSRSRR